MAHLVSRFSDLSGPLRLAFGSIVIALAVLALKYAAYWTTNSVGLLSDALETVVNLAASFAVVIALWVGEIPADDNHPYGHHKAEYLSAVLEGVLIVIAALIIFGEAFESFTNPRDLDVPLIGPVLNGLAGVLNGVWASVLIRHGRAQRSPALVADGKHLLTDVYSSIGVLAGVGIAVWSGLTWIDPLLAFLIAINILWTGWGLIKSSVGGLMDEAVDDEELGLIRTTIAHTGQGAIEAHDLRTRRAGRMTFVEFHLVVPSDMSVYQAHEICDRIEQGLKDKLHASYITIHVEPEDMAHQHDHNVEKEGCIVF